jgi:hypothetical protein
VCGPIEGVFLYYCDNLVAGGCDFMIECLRQAQHDLGKLLADHSTPLVLPKRVVFAFDNCPTENKASYRSEPIYLL